MKFLFKYLAWPAMFHLSPTSGRKEAGLRGLSWPPMEEKLSRLKKEELPADKALDSYEAGYEDISNSLEEEDWITTNWPPIDTELAFIGHCQDWFLSDSSPSFISQHTFASFLATECDILDDEDLPAFNCPLPTFESLDMHIQLVFVKHVCEDEEDSLEDLRCLNSLLSSLEEFGFYASQKNRRWTSMAIYDICCNLLPFLSRVKLQPNIGTFL
jgi:hypothetical protein